MIINTGMRTDINPPTKKEQIELAKSFIKIGKENNMVIHSCCEKTYSNKGLVIENMKKHNEK